MPTYTFDADGALAAFLEVAYQAEVISIHEWLAEKKVPPSPYAQDACDEVWSSIQTFTGMDWPHQACRPLAAVRGLELSAQKYRRTRYIRMRILNGIAVRIYARALIMLTEADTGSEEAGIILEILTDLRDSHKCRPLESLLPIGGAKYLKKG